MLAAVKAEPWRAREVRGLDGHCARRCYDVRAGMEGWAPQGPNKRMRSEERREVLLATCLQVGACSRLGEMLVIDFDRRPEAVEFARARIELPGDSIQFLLGQT